MNSIVTEPPSPRSKAKLNFISTFLTTLFQNSHLTKHVIKDCDLLETTNCQGQLVSPYGINAPLPRKSQIIIFQSETYTCYRHRILTGNAIVYSCTTFITAL